MSERTIIAIALIAVAVITVAGWISLSHSDDEMEVDFEKLKRTERD